MMPGNVICTNSTAIHFCEHVIKQGNVVMKQAIARISTGRAERQAIAALTRVKKSPSADSVIIRITQLIKCVRNQNWVRRNLFL